MYVLIFVALKQSTLYNLQQKEINPSREKKGKQKQPIKGLWESTGHKLHTLREICLFVYY